MFIRISNKSPAAAVSLAMAFMVISNELPTMPGERAWLLAGSSAHSHARVTVPLLPPAFPHPWALGGRGKEPWV